MKKADKGHFRNGMLCMLLSLSLLSPLTFTACVNAHPELDIEIETDYTQIIAAIADSQKSLKDKMDLIEQAVKNGLSQNESLLKLVQCAVESLSGTLEEKLAAIQQALNAQGVSLESKLALVEAAMESGFADDAARQALLTQAIESLGGTLEERVSALEEAMKAQTASLETKLALVEAAFKGGFTSADEQDKLLQKAVESLQGTLEEKLADIEKVMTSQATSLESKLGLLSKALEEGLADQGQALENMKKALDTTLKGTDADLSQLEADVMEELSALSQKLTTEELAKALKGIADTIDSQNQSMEKLLESIREALVDTEESLKETPLLTFAGDPTATITVTKGEEFSIAFTVSPDSTRLVKDSLKVNMISRKLFYPEGSGLHTEADHFTVKSLEKDPDIAGRYTVTLTANSIGAVWDESALSFTYNFGNKRRARYVVTQPFAVTMMPRAKDALQRSYYPNGSFLMSLPVQGHVMGNIYYALGSMRFNTEDGAETRTYSVDNLTRAKFIQPDKPDTASVFTTLDKKKHFLSFSPDTVGNHAWREFQKHYAEDHRFQEVSGRLALTDRWGATDSIDLAMKWFVTWPIPYEIVDTVNVRKPSDFDRPGENYVLPYSEIWPKRLNLWGLDFDDIHSCGVELENTPNGCGDGFEEMQLIIPEESDSSTYLEVLKGVQPVPGKQFQALGFLGLYARPSDVDPSFRPAQIYYDYHITIKVIDENDTE